MIIRLFPTYIYILVYGRAECASISLECTKVKLLIFNNFDSDMIFNFRYIRMHLCLIFILVFLNYISGGLINVHRVNDGKLTVLILYLNMKIFFSLICCSKNLIGLFFGHFLPKSCCRKKYHLIKEKNFMTSLLPG